MCSKGFKDESSLRRHCSSHKEKAYTCVDCDRTFTRAADMKAHRVVHQKRTRHTCSVCGKSYSKVPAGGAGRTGGRLIP